MFVGLLLLFVNDSFDSKHTFSSDDHLSFFLFLPFFCFGFLLTHNLII